MNLIRLTKPIYKHGECINKITIYINIDHISTIEETKKLLTAKTIIILNNQHAIKVCEGMDDVVTQCHAIKGG